jgi:hypothetical protein
LSAADGIEGDIGMALIAAADIPRRAAVPDDDEFERPRSEATSNDV